MILSEAASRGLQNPYDMVNVIEFGKVAIQWSKKLAFTDRLAFLASSL